MRHFRSGAFFALVSAVSTLLLPAVRAGEAGPRTLTFDERVAAQRAIESVFWEHRIWPSENSGAKPSLDEVMPAATIREKVEDTLRKSNALAALWGRPVTGDQLQAEVERMARESKQPDVLKELFAALDDDPVLIAECLARPFLVDRLLRNWFAADERIHGEVRRRAERELASHATVTEMQQLGGTYSRVTWTLADGSSPAARAFGGDTLTLEDWTRMRETLSERSRASRGPAAGLSGPLAPAPAAPGMTGVPSLDGAVPLNTLSRLSDEGSSFSVTALLDQGEHSMTVATVTWPKTPFETWWNREREKLTAELPPSGQQYSPVPLSPNACTNDTWTQTAYEAPDGRNQHTAVWTGTEMIVWGGYFGTALNTGGRYNPSTDTWTPTSTGAGVPTGRYSHTAVWTGTQMIVFGGQDLNTSVLAGGARYTPSSDTWAATNLTGAPAARTNHTAIWTGTEMIVFGGATTTGITNSGGRYNPGTNLWSTTSLTGAVARYYHAAVWTGTEMIVWGGHNGTTVINTGGRYNPSTNVWGVAPTVTGAPSGRIFHTAIWTGSRMVVWGGWDTGANFYNTGGIWDPGANSWVATSTGVNVPSLRAAHTAVWTGSRMIVWGGTDNVLTFNSGALFDPTANSWTGTTTLVNAPAGRFYHPAVWTGTRMIVWAGANAGNNGGQYDPALDSWTPTSQGTSVIHARYYHADVWDGTDVLVWGGWDGTTVNSGSRYNPGLNTWTPTSTGLGVPAARAYPSAVWNGTEMIVWGGTPDFVAVTNSGGRYNPMTDSWTPTSTGLNVPVGRKFHVAVWSGNRMIVWGGDDGTIALNSGGRYDPVTDSWLPTSQGTNVPSARNESNSTVSVWTGSVLVVWGGYDLTSWLNTGGRYDPATDTWQTTSAGLNVPSVRATHSMVWTGTEVIVFGGWSGTAVLNTGGRYNPATDSWGTISTVGAPSARQFPSAVWTGGEMIVWGGDDSFNALNTGSRYNPATNTWTAASAAGSPTPQYEGRAVWTGERMFFLGASSRAGLYCPNSPCSVNTWFRDADGDSLGNSTDSVLACSQPAGYIATGGDCNDADSNSYATPGEVTALMLAVPDTLSWTAPATGGTASAMLYDTLRSDDPADFTNPATCIETTDGPNTVAADSAIPVVGQLFSYLTRARNGCPGGPGTLGTDSNAVQRIGRTCP